MQFSKEEYARKRIHNYRSVRTENSVTQENYSVSLGRPRDAEQLRSIRTSKPFKNSYITQWSSRRLSDM